MVNDEMHFWFQGIGYKEGFGPGKVRSTKVRKRLIDIDYILSAVNLEERRKIFSERKVFMVFLTHVISFFR